LTTLDQDDLTAIRGLIADAQTAPRLVDVPTLAATLSVSTDFVRAHQDELGAIRVGSLIRFDPTAAVERMRTSSTPTTSKLATTTRTRSRRTVSSVELLPIRGDRA
jgi:hypothetical protein